MQTSSNELKRPQVEVIPQEDETKIGVRIDDTQYLVQRHQGMKAYTLGQLVKKVIVPMRSSVEALVADAFGKMSAEARQEFERLQKDSEEHPENQGANEVKAAELLNISPADYMRAENEAWAAVNPDESEKFLLALFSQTIGQGSGNLGNKENFEKHFNHKRLHHIDLLKAEVIKFNGFLDSQRNPGL